MKATVGSPRAIQTRHVDRSPASSLANGHIHPSRHMRALFPASFTIAGLLAAVSVLGFVLGLRGQYGDPASALGPTESTSGVLVPGFLGQDVFNLIVGVPLLVAVVCLARRGNTVACLLWPGALFYVMYTFAIYMIGAPFGGLFPLYAVLVALSGYTTIALLATLDPGPVYEQIRNEMPARGVGGLMAVLAVLTIAQDASGALSAAVAGGTAGASLARPVWAVDLSIEAPAVLIGSVLLWSRHPLGYLCSPGLLLQYGMTPSALAVTAMLQGFVTGTPVAWATVAGLLLFALVCGVPLVLLVSGSAPNQVAAPHGRRRRSGSRS